MSDFTPTRQRVLTLLDQPRCPREIRERIPGAHRKRIETALQRLAQDRLVECVTPRLRQSRMYRRTYLGTLLVYELTGATPPIWRSRGDDELELRAFIQAGKYRRLVLRAMTGEQTPKEIRRGVLPEYRRIGANHVHAVLRSFAAHGIARRDEHHRWSLTPLGDRLRAIELDGLPERPASVGAIWERITPTKQYEQHHEHADCRNEQEKV